MKLNKIVSITGVLLFASLVASCQKDHFQTKGLVSKWEMPSRGIASVKSSPTLKDRFVNYQDPKQILIFCELNSAKANICYKSHFEKLLTKFQKNNNQVSDLEFSELRMSFSYENTKSSLDSIINDISFKTNPKLNKLVEARKAFCAKNSEYFLQKCLTQYVEKDTFSVLNQFHGKNKMNGHEYLYLKSIIKTKFETKLNEAKTVIESNKKSI